MPMTTGFCKLPLSGHLPFKIGAVNGCRDAERCLEDAVEEKMDY
jgi:hypothetical protein